MKAKKKIFKITALRSSFTNTLAELLIYKYDNSFKLKTLTKCLKRIF